MLATAEQISPARLDPRARRLIPKLSFAGDVMDLDPVEARRSYNRARQPYAWPLESVGNITSIARRYDGTPALKIFRPQISSIEATDSYLFFHGGGWSLGDLTIYEPLCRRLANQLQANIVWVDYRLAPEHPFPAALDDAAAATVWLIKHAASLGLSRDRLSLIGDSAGANIAAVLALLNRRAVYGERFRHQVLVYPCLDLTASYPSHRELAEGYLLTRDLYGWYRRNYVQEHDPTDWRLSPLFAAGLKEVAPAVILRAGFDPLRDEAQAYGQRLRLAGVPVQEIYFPEMLHGFLTMGAVFPQAASAIEQIKRALASSQNYAARASSRSSNR